MSGVPRGYKTPGSGKKKGTPNKASLRVAEKAALLGIDPATVLLFFAAGRWQELGYTQDVITPEMRIKAAGDVMKYIAPMLKAIEHTGADNGPIQTVNVFDTAWRDGTDTDKEPS